MSERFTGLSTDAEERWLAGQGPEPGSPSRRLPERAGLLVPRAGAVAWSRAARRDRVTVRDGALVLHRGDGERVLAAPGTVRRLVWLAPGAVPRSARWVPSPLGHVLVDAAEPVVFRVGDWVPGELVGRGSDALRAAGFEGLARELGVPLEVVSTPGAVALPHWRATVLAERGAAATLTCGGLLVAGLVAGVAGLAAGHLAAGVAIALTLFLVCAGIDLVAALVTRRAAWSTAVGGGRVHATGRTAVAVRPGLRGSEVVLAERRGWQSWAAGPDLGGVSSLVVARASASDRPWGVLVLDRDERVLAALPADRWLPDGDPATLEAAVGSPEGVRVSTAVLPEWPADRLHRSTTPGSDRAPGGYAVGGRAGLAGIGLLSAVALAAGSGAALVAVAAGAVVAVGLVLGARRVQ